MRDATGFSVSGFRRRAHSSATVLWALLAAFSPIGVPILHSLEAQHIVTPPAQVHAHVVEANGGVHERGCPHAPPPSHHDGGACLTCRTLQHGKFSSVASVARLVALLRPGTLLGDQERPATAWVDLSTSVPRAPPLFS